MISYNLQMCLDPDLSVKEVQLLRSAYLTSVGVSLNV